MSKYIFVDVEATGRSPINGTMTEFGAVEYKTRQTFHGRIWEAKPDPANPAKSILTGQEVEPLHEVMFKFKDWLAALGKSRAIFISDNPAYDFMWIACAFDEAGLDNPFGHSGRRISDYYAGLTGNFSNSQEWKQYRVTPHDHNPVNDAMGNVEAFAKIQELFQAKEALSNDVTTGGDKESLPRS